MNILWYPDFKKKRAALGIKNFISKDLVKHKDLPLLVELFFMKLEAMKDPGDLFISGQLAFLREGLCEMRIPKQRRGGVVRIYFCFSRVEKATIVILDAELKHEKSPSRMETALVRMTKYNRFQKGN